MFERKKLFIVIFSLSLLCGILLPAFLISDGSRVSADEFFLDGERLEYSVKWWIFRIGTIVTTTEKIVDTTQRGSYRVRIALDSNPDLFFIHVKSRYESILTHSPLRCIQFIGHEIEGKDTLVTYYWIDDSLRQVKMEQWKYPAGKKIKEKVQDSLDAFYEGASLVFLARQMLHSGLQINAPTVVDMDFFTTTINFTEKTKQISLGVLDHPVEGKELYGKAHFVGKSLAGFSGDFRGWFSNDKAAIPLRAEMNITLGTATIELIRWNRDGWITPQKEESR